MKDSSYQQSHQTGMLTFAGDLPNICSLAGLLCALLRSLKNRLIEGGTIILRESTVHQGISLSQGEYQAVYRSVNRYRQLFDRVGLFRMEVRRNYGYTNLVTAEELVNLRRRWLPFLPGNSTTLGSLTWWALRLTAPITFWVLPQILSQLNIPWPRLQNHFFRLRIEKDGNRSQT